MVGVVRSIVRSIARKIGVGGLYPTDSPSDADAQTILRREPDGTVSVVSLGDVASFTLTRQPDGTVTVS